MLNRAYCRWLVALAVALALAPVLAYAADDKAAEYKKDDGPHKVATLSVEWKDAKRERSVPAKIYYPETGKGPLAVMIFSHGLGGSREGYSYLGQHWASHGYVCAHLQHAGSDDALWRGQKNAKEQMAKAAKEPKNAINRPLDVSFAIDQLTAMQADKESPLSGRLDLGHIGMAGHSFGAITTLMIAGEAATKADDGKLLSDQRIKAGIPMSSPVPKRQKEYDTVYGNIQIPLLHMTGTRDESPISKTKADDRRIPYDHITKADQYLVTLVGGDHKVFSGRARIGPRKPKDAKFQDLILMSTTAFWDAYLKDDKAAKEWLQNGGMKAAMGADAKVEQKRTGKDDETKKPVQ
jgi:dienelactone hydrolase